MNAQPMITDPNLSRATLAALTDPLMARAEQIASKHPAAVDVPPGFHWPDEVLEEIARVEKARDAWAEADAALAEAIQDHAEAVAADQLALRESVKAGKSTHPGTPRTQKARQALEVALTRCEIARTNASRAAQGPLRGMLESSASRSQALAAVQKAEADTLAVLAHMRATLAELNQARYIAFQMAKFAAAQKGVQMGERSASISVKFPTEYEARMTQIIDTLERV